MQLDKYERRAKHNISERSLQTRLSALRNLDEFINGGEATPEDVEEWIDSLIRDFEDGKIKASTIRSYYKYTRYYFEKVKGSDEGIEHIKSYLPDNDSSPGEYLDNEEWELLIQSTEHYRTKTFIEVLYHYARRPSEVRFLNKEDIDFEEETITFNILKKDSNKRTPSTGLKVLEIQNSKGDWSEYDVYRATFQLKMDKLKTLKRYLKFRPDKEEEIKLDGERQTVSPVFVTSNGRIGERTVIENVKGAAEAAGIEKNITPKSMRHTRATHLDWEGHAPGEVSRHQLLHSPGSNVITRYIHDREEDKVRDVMGEKDEEDEQE